MVIRTTPEHPFYVSGTGWLPAAYLTGGEWLLTATGEWLRCEEAHDTGECERVYNCRVAEHHTYFVGDAEWGHELWAHNQICSNPNAIIIAVEAEEGVTPGGGWGHGAKKSGVRSEWASDAYLKQHLQAKINKEYASVTPALTSDDVIRLADKIADRMFEAVKRDAVQRTTFVPKGMPKYLPTSTAVTGDPMAYPKRQYTLNTNSPLVVDLNNGSWDVKNEDALKGLGGIYILRNTDTGRIYKVGTSNKLTGRMETYSKEWVARDKRVTAEVYTLGPNTGSTIAEQVMRGYIVKSDKWDLKEADGTWDEYKAQRSGGFSIGVK